MSEVSRPWQGSVLAVFFYGLAGFSLFSVMITFSSLMMFGAAGEMMQAMAGLQGGAGLVATAISFVTTSFSMIALPFGYLFYAMGRGFWRGKFWPLVLVMFSVGVLFVLSLLAVQFPLMLMMAVPSVFLMTVWRHPFYRQAR